MFEVANVPLCDAEDVTPNKEEEEATYKEEAGEDELGNFTFKDPREEGQKDAQTTTTTTTTTTTDKGKIFVPVSSPTFMIEQDKGIDQLLDDLTEMDMEGGESTTLK
ncbi:hypothetical protein J1N35_033764 [Gossypium stocksii]|uniref:Uncharacterized protein n=1 Tax=Gossypium stocksii TaxID=47602 RepID=A0A9D3USQ1_9ROSI|nr:hypothetical protein J1N35_033764 [Gossypium stocksii]